LWIKRDKAISFKQRKHCKKELKLPEMKQKHWCRTSESAAETEFRVSATLWEVCPEWVKTDLKLFLSKFFANPAANLLGLGINVFRNTFRLALKLVKTCSNDSYFWKAREYWFSRMFPALASKHGENLKTNLFPKHINSQA
jgi:hypothetical protein